MSSTPPSNWLTPEVHSRTLSATVRDSQTMQYADSGMSERYAAIRSAERTAWPRPTCTLRNLRMRASPVLNVVDVVVFVFSLWRRCWCGDLRSMNAAFAKQDSAHPGLPGCKRRLRQVRSSARWSC